MARKKKINPFKDVETIDEFLKVLRRECTSLRGQAYKHWIIPQDNQPHITGTSSSDLKLRFCIDADITAGTIRDFPADIDWLEIFEGTNSRDFRSNTFLGRWRGYGLLNINGGGSGKYSTTHKRWASIYLKHVPKLMKLVLKNRELVQARVAMVEADPELLELRKAEARLLSQMAVRKDAILADFDKKFPRRSPFTGKPTP